MNKCKHDTKDMRTYIEPAMYVREKLNFWSQRSSYNHSINTTLTVHVVCSDDRIQRLVPRPFSLFSSAILNSYTDYRCALVPKLPFPVPRSRFPVPRSPFPVPRSPFPVLVTPQFFTFLFELVASLTSLAKESGPMPLKTVVYLSSLRTYCYFRSQEKGIYNVKQLRTCSKNANDKEFYFNDFYAGSYPSGPINFFAIGSWDTSSPHSLT